MATFPLCVEFFRCRVDVLQSNFHVEGIFRYFYLFATQLHYLKMPKEKKKNVGRDGEEA